MSKKKKITYKINYSNKANYSIFSSLEGTLLPVKEINGINVQSETGCFHCEIFPNPGAINMMLNYKILEKVMGNHLASTVIEYLDKETEDTVALLFPTNELMYPEDTPNFMERLNHASRQDLAFQMKRRALLLKEVLNNLKQK